MYQFPNPQKHYNKEFLEAFTKENDIESDTIRQWRHFPNKHKHESFGMYSVDSLASPYYYTGAMLCKLFGVFDSARFTIEMGPLMEVAIHYYIMDWATILSNKMANQIHNYRRNRFVTTHTIPPFYMSTYIMDTICFNSDYPILCWKWAPQDPTPIHIYHNYLQKAHYKDHIYRICHGFILHVQQAIFNKPAPQLSDEISIDLTSIGNWFVEEIFTYVKLFGSTIDPYVLPLYIPDKLLAKEIIYQIIET